VVLLSAKLAGEIEAREKAVTLKMQAVNPVSGSEAAREAKGEVNNRALVRSAEVPDRIPASLATREPEVRPGRAQHPSFRQTIYRGWTSLFSKPRPVPFKQRRPAQSTGEGLPRL
jgi:hypothetical protein